eukprot:c699_g1_i1.p1 GENE.c699_g1_i1~~c699_g1_i1.p1  ORF type:complete len:281 (+),score=-1.75 c699_g1_i1:149-991(+)
MQSRIQSVVLSGVYWVLPVTFHVPSLDDEQPFRFLAIGFYGHFVTVSCLGLLFQNYISRSLTKKRRTFLRRVFLAGSSGLEYRGSDSERPVRKTNRRSNRNVQRNELGNERGRDGAKERAIIAFSNDFRDEFNSTFASSPVQFELAEQSGNKEYVNATEVDNEIDNSPNTLAIFAVFGRTAKTEGGFAALIQNGNGPSRLSQSAIRDCFDSWIKRIGTRIAAKNRFLPIVLYTDYNLNHLHPRTKENHDISRHRFSQDFDCRSSIAGGLQQLRDQLHDAR